MVCCFAMILVECCTLVRQDSGKPIKKQYRQGTIGCQLVPIISVRLSHGILKHCTALSYYQKLLWAIQPWSGNWLIILNVKEPQSKKKIITLLIQSVQRPCPSSPPTKLPFLHRIFRTPKEFLPASHNSCNALQHPLLNLSSRYSCTMTKPSASPSKVKDFFSNASSHSHSHSVQESPRYANEKQSERQEDRRTER